jgi:hypothetical protein
MAFHSPAFAWLAYFSPAAPLLHRILYLFRKPFYDYSRGIPLNAPASPAHGGASKRRRRGV